MKLIDPRGEFGSHVIYGDQRYDLAKLRHSVAGKYDFIINDMFDINVDAQASTIDYEVYRNNVHEEREQLFDSLLQQKYRGWFKHIRLIESLLFLSMVPLHSDNKRRQGYMLARGLELFNEVANL